eukprot:10748545-Alexandrium_andersonii.AAC.1
MSAHVELHAAPTARICPRGAQQKTSQAQPGAKHRKAHCAGTCDMATVLPAICHALARPWRR